MREKQADATAWTHATNHGYVTLPNAATGDGFPDAFGGGPGAGSQPGHSMPVTARRC